MRGDDEQSGHLFSYLSPEQRVPADHPLRTIRVMTDEALRRLSPRFDAIDATTGRPSIPPEHLLRALLLQGLRDEGQAESEIIDLEAYAAELQAESDEDGKN